MFSVDGIWIFEAYPSPILNRELSEADKSTFIRISYSFPMRLVLNLYGLVRAGVHQNAMSVAVAS